MMFILDRYVEHILENEDAGWIAASVKFVMNTFFFFFFFFLALIVSKMCPVCKLQL